MWEEIKGHHTQKRLLKKAIAEKKLAYAYLFSGHKGVGKSLVAQHFATALLTDSMHETQAERVAKRIQENQHPDFFKLEAEKESIKISQVRSLTGKLQYHPLESTRKVVIVKQADMMTESAANALLKTLEEPPPQTHFILITNLPYKVLATIRSRCQHIRFSPLGESIVSKYLQKEKNIEAETAHQLAKISQGSIGTAKDLDPRFIRSVIERFQALSDKGSAADIIALSEEWARDEQTGLILELLASWYRDLLYYKQTQDENGLIYKEAKAAHVSNDYADKSLHSIMETRKLLHTTANKQLLFEQLLFTLKG